VGPFHPASPVRAVGSPSHSHGWHRWIPFKPLALSSLSPPFPTSFMEALVARSSVLSPPAVAGDASPSPSRPRVSAALPGPRRSPSTLAICTRWTRASHRRGGGRLLAGSGEGGSPDPAGGAVGKEEYSPLLEVLADALLGN
jgi:hypothetical protein